MCRHSIFHLNVLFLRWTLALIVRFAFLMFCFKTNSKLVSHLATTKLSLALLKEISHAPFSKKEVVFSVQQKFSAPLSACLQSAFLSSIVAACCFSTIFINIMKGSHWFFNMTPWVRPVLPEIAKLNHKVNRYNVQLSLINWNESLAVLYKYMHALFCCQSNTSFVS